MHQDAYELAALAARYVFAALMLWIVWRAGRGAAVDSRRAARLRRLSPMTGLCGEMVVLEGDERARRGMRYPVIREGTLGSARRADIRIRHSSVRRRHAYFQLLDDGLHLRGHAGARLRDGDGHAVRDLVLADGDCLSVGQVRLMLVLSAPEQAQRHEAHPHARDDFDSPDGLFDLPADAGWRTPPDDGWEVAPSGRPRESGDWNVSPTTRRDSYESDDLPGAEAPDGWQTAARPQAEDHWQHTHSDPGWTGRLPRSTPPERTGAAQRNVRTAKPWHEDDWREDTSLKADTADWDGTPSSDGDADEALYGDRKPRKKRRF